jgi:hypothetical protein
MGGRTAFEVLPVAVVVSQLEQSRVSQFRVVLNRLELVLAAALKERNEGLQKKWPELPPVRLAGVDLVDRKTNLEMAYGVGSQAALANRFDLMNARAEVVDAWRQITVSANALLGVFNVRYHGELLSPFDEAKPVTVGGSRFRHQLILTGELPLVRLQERNVYRAALIAFQRARRRMMSEEDRVVSDIRTEIRQLRNLADNYRIQKEQVQLAYSQVDSSLEALLEPPDPKAQTDTATRAAALTQQLLGALRSLPQAQNQLYSTWIQYLITRLQLYRDLELMPLDHRGVWIDDLSNLSLDPAALQRPVEPFDLPVPRRVAPAAQGQALDQ